MKNKLTIKTFTAVKVLKTQLTNKIQLENKSPWAITDHVGEVCSHTQPLNGTSDAGQQYSQGVWTYTNCRVRLMHHH